MKLIKSLPNIISKIYRLVVILITVFLFIIVAYNVIRRYVFNNSIAWADEMARFSFIWVNLLAIIHVFQHNELIKLDLVSAIISKTRAGRYFLEITEFLIINLILGVLTYYSIQFISVMSHVSATLALPMKIVYAVLPFSMSCMFIGNIVKFINLIKLNRKS